jgi:hypothetical protein
VIRVGFDSEHYGQAGRTDSEFEQCSSILAFEEGCGSNLIWYVLSMKAAGFEAVVHKNENAKQLTHQHRGC